MREEELINSILERAPSVEYAFIDKFEDQIDLWLFVSEHSFENRIDIVRIEEDLKKGCLPKFLSIHVSAHHGMPIEEFQPLDSVGIYRRRLFSNENESKTMAV